MAVYLIRPATEQEREKVAASWHTILTLPRRRGLDDEAASAVLFDLGRFEVARGWLAKAILDRIDALIGEVSVLVADHPEVPGYPLGWIAFEADTLHAMHVDAESRGQWIGRTLLAHALAEIGPSPRCSILTEAGRRLLDHARSHQEAA